MKIQDLSRDGVEHVCDVVQAPHNRWFYSNINQDLMFQEHKSWVYFIVDQDEIVKIGQTGVPLGIRCSNSEQPLSGTKCRLGRYRGGSDTDDYIRRELRKSVKQGQVSVWARKCLVVSIETTVNGESFVLENKFQKDLELAYLDRYRELTGHLPRLNKGRG
jgi:hypothetical protein